MIEIFKHFNFYDNCTLPEKFKPRNRPSRKNEYQLVWKVPKDDVRGLQANFFYFQTTKTRNELPKEIVHAKSIDLFKNKLHEAWKDLPIKFYEQERFIEGYICLRIWNSWIIKKDRKSLLSLKSDFYLLKNVIFYFNESPINNVFYFILKAVFVLTIVKFFSWLFWLCRKTAWQESLDKLQNLWRQISQLSPDVSRSKSNQTVKFGPLIEYNARNNFLQKSCRKWDRETSFRHFFVFL